MKNSPKIHYLLLALALILVLSGCELARGNNEASDLAPLQSLPPTLAPLGAEDAVLAEATAVPTVLSVQPTATAPAQVATGMEEVNPIELVAPTAQPPSVSAEPVAENSNTQEVTTPEDSAAAIEPAASSSIIVSAPTTDELPEGGPVAANPPASGANVIPAASSGGAYVVQAGDTLFGISQRYGTSVEAIVAANGLSSDVVQIGQTLNIPTDDTAAAPPAYDNTPAYQDNAPAYQPIAPNAAGGNYLIGPRDTLFSLAQRYGTTVEAIASANGISYPYIIHEGQSIIIPGADGAYAAPAPYMPSQEYPQQPPTDNYYQQPDQGYYPQQPTDGYYQQPGQGYQQPADGYYQQPGQGYQQPADGYYQQPGQGYQQPEGGYYPQPGYGEQGMPGPAGSHTVAPGETLYSIASRYGLSAEAIAAANGLANPNQIFVGQVLFLP